MFSAPRRESLELVGFEGLVLDVGLMVCLELLLRCLHERHYLKWNACRFP